MIVVADSSPFVVLVTIGHVEVLPALFERIIIPPEVLAELASPMRKEAVRALVASCPAWLEIRLPTSVETIGGLHPGETSAIALALELNADRLIIDEQRGRQAATQRGLQVVGTIGVLEFAAEAELIELERAFQDVKQTDFWVSPMFLDERLTRFRERKARGT